MPSQSPMYKSPKELMVENSTVLVYSRNNTKDTLMLFTGKYFTCRLGIGLEIKATYLSKTQNAYIPSEK